MEILGEQEEFIITVGQGPKEWEDIVVKFEDIEKIINKNE